MKVALYIRVSTRDKQDVSKQRDYLLNYVKHHEGWEVFDVFADVGISGQKSSRPALDDMLSKIDEWDAVLVYKLDRIGRSMRHLLNLTELFRKKNKHFASATQAIDTSKPEGRLFFNMLASFAEFEREITVMRIKDGLAAAKARGRKFGRKKGQKDVKPRRRVGYYLRWEKERLMKGNLPKSEIEKQLAKTRLKPESFAE